MILILNSHYIVDGVHYKLMLDISIIFVSHPEHFLKGQVMNVINK